MSPRGQASLPRACLSAFSYPLSSSLAVGLPVGRLLLVYAVSSFYFLLLFVLYRIIRFTFHASALAQFDFVEYIYIYYYRVRNTD